VELADEIGGDDYKIFVDAAMSGSAPAAAATLDWYKIWSNASRADPALLVNAEAFAYDPETESTPQFDPAAVMLALELLSDNCKEPRIALFEMEGIHFLEPGDGTWSSQSCYHDNNYAYASLGSFQIWHSQILPCVSPSLLLFFIYSFEIKK
jgi:hypothetical protein